MRYEDIARLRRRKGVPKGVAKQGLCLALVHSLVKEASAGLLSRCTLWQLGHAPNDVGEDASSDIKSLCSALTDLSRQYRITFHRIFKSLGSIN